MIISLSGRRVKRIRTLKTAKWVGRHIVAVSLMREPLLHWVLRPAKAPAPWAGVRYRLVETNSLVDGKAMRPGSEASHVD